MSTSRSATTMSRSNVAIAICKSWSTLRFESPPLPCVSSFCFLPSSWANSARSVAIESCNCLTDSTRSLTTSSCTPGPKTRQPVSVIDTCVFSVFLFPLPLAALRKWERNFSFLKTKNGRFFVTMRSAPPPEEPPRPPMPVVSICSLNFSEISPHCHISELMEEATELLPPAPIETIWCSFPEPSCSFLVGWITLSGATLSLLLPHPNCPSLLRPQAQTRPGAASTRQ
mmetsp:Transcript_16920/g.43101  ORF Transcript_16920/g.43101 Transcript_16920/m.43101 type:complete len:228 (-) Transcript_16920:445-1128(-)